MKFELYNKNEQTILMNVLDTEADRLMALANGKATERFNRTDRNQARKEAKVLISLRERLLWRIQKNKIAKKKPARTSLAEKQRFRARMMVKLASKIISTSPRNPLTAVSTAEKIVDTIFRVIEGREG